MPKAEGRIFDFKPEEEIKTYFLETVSFSEPKELISIETFEFSAVCPFSGLPDIAKLEIAYFPEGGKIIELKSLKYYLVSFRNVGIYQERATERIYKDLKKILDTDKIRVAMTYNIRGGILVKTEIGSLKGD